jgi:hypothetical protein
MDSSQGGSGNGSSPSSGGNRKRYHNQVGGSGNRSGEPPSNRPRRSITSTFNAPPQQDYSRAGPSYYQHDATASRVRNRDVVNDDGGPSTSAGPARQSTRHDRPPRAPLGRNLFRPRMSERVANANFKPRSISGGTLNQSTSAARPSHNPIGGRVFGPRDYGEGSTSGPSAPRRNISGDVFNRPLGEEYKLKSRSRKQPPQDVPDTSLGGSRIIRSKKNWGAKKARKAQADTAQQDLIDFAAIQAENQPRRTPTSSSVRPNGANDTSGGTIDQAQSIIKRRRQDKGKSPSSSSSSSSGSNNGPAWPPLDVGPPTPRSIAQERAILAVASQVSPEALASSMNIPPPGVSSQEWRTLNAATQRYTPRLQQVGSVSVIGQGDSQDDFSLPATPNMFILPPDELANRRERLRLQREDHELISWSTGRSAPVWDKISMRSQQDNTWQDTNTRGYFRMWGTSREERSEQLLGINTMANDRRPSGRSYDYDQGQQLTVSDIANMRHGSKVRREHRDPTGSTWVCLSEQNWKEFGPYFVVNVGPITMDVCTCPDFDRHLQLRANYLAQNRASLGFMAPYKCKHILAVMNIQTTHYNEVNMSSRFDWDRWSDLTGRQVPPLPTPAEVNRLRRMNVGDAAVDAYLAEQLNYMGQGFGNVVQRDNDAGNVGGSQGPYSQPRQRSSQRSRSSPSSASSQSSGSDGPANNSQYDHYAKSVASHRRGGASRRYYRGRQGLQELARFKPQGNESRREYIQRSLDMWKQYRGQPDKYTPAQRDSMAAQTLEDIVEHGPRGLQVPEDEDYVYHDTSSQVFINPSPAEGDFATMNVDDLFNWYVEQFSVPGTSGGGGAASSSQSRDPNVGTSGMGTQPYDDNEVDIPETPTPLAGAGVAIGIPGAEEPQVDEEATQVLDPEEIARLLMIERRRFNRYEDEQFDPRDPKGKGRML